MMAKEYRFLGIEKCRDLQRFLADMCQALCYGPSPFLQPGSHYRSTRSSRFCIISESYSLSPEAMSSFVATGQQRYLRACMVCSIVQTHTVSYTPDYLAAVRVFASDLLKFIPSAS